MDGYKNLKLILKEFPIRNDEYGFSVVSSMIEMCIIESSSRCYMKQKLYSRFILF